MKNQTYPPALEKPEYYYRWWKDEHGKKYHCVYERNIAGEDGICVYDSVREHDARAQLAALRR